MSLRLVERPAVYRGQHGQPRPYPLQGLEKALRWPPPGRLAMKLVVHPRQVYRWRKYGLTAEQADELAVRCGLHPAEVWPDW